ncbi:Mbov_0283/Mbov_0339 family surface lipoprotein [Metamycoplasma auris]|uniref:Lipoprotein n=1 Tax=Metamycoplasma auris TaxID=51363 RepID=A0A2W7GWA4_9BACT|nr:hypothetical protein [Metamycoplasma auris]PZW01499.1 hypothetical protein BCF89_10114 [Metamycoplasma auris]
MKAKKLFLISASLLGSLIPLAAVSCKKEKIDKKEDIHPKNDHDNGKDKNSNPQPGNTENKEPKTDDSANGETKPSESTPNDAPSEKSELDRYIDKVKEYGKEASEFFDLASRLIQTKYKEEISKKYGKFGEIIKGLSKLYEGIKSNLDETRKQIIEGFKDPESKKALLEYLNSYEESREEIQTAIKELKEIEKRK